MNLYIMTRGRVGRQITWQSIPDVLKGHTFILCPGQEFWDHVNSGIPKENVKVAPHHITNYSEKFKYIMQDGMGDGQEKAVILDDDLTFSMPYIREDGQRRLQTIKPGDSLVPIHGGFGYMEYLLNDTALVGFHPRQMGHTKEPPYVENGKVICVQGINRTRVGHIPDLDRFPILADVVLNATLLERGQSNKLITTLFIDWGSCQAPGGCSLTRTPFIQAEACFWLEDRFGPYIKAVKKEAKNGWLGGERVDFRGQWQKLYRAGAAVVLDRGKGVSPDPQGDGRTETVE